MIYFIILELILILWDYIVLDVVGTSVVVEWPLDLFLLHLTCRYKLDSPGFRGGFAEILVGLSRGGTHPRYSLVSNALHWAPLVSFQSIFFPI